MLFAFGSFTLDPVQRKISHNGCAFPLPPKVFDVLFYLVRHSERIVTKEELREAVWSDVHVDDANLTQTVFLLRRQLKAFDSHVRIVTVPQQGYQFAVEVKRMEPAVNGMPAARACSVNPAEGRFVRLVHRLLGTRTAGALSAAVRWCERAKRRYNVCAAVHVNLANALCLSMSVGGIKPSRALAKVQNALLSALEIDPKTASVLAPLGYLRCHFDTDWQRAEADFRQALEKCPDDLLACHWYGELLCAFGRFDESLAILRRAEQVYPWSLLIRTDVAMALFLAREYKDCEAQALKTLDFDPCFSRTRLILAAAYAQRGLYDKACKFLQAAPADETYVTMLTLRADVYSAMGKRNDALKALHQLYDLNSQRYVSPYGIGFAHAAVGDSDEAFAWFGRAAKERDYWLIWLRVKPNLDPYRRDPRFQNLLHKARLVSHVG